MNSNSANSIWLYRLKALLLAVTILALLTAVPFLLDLLNNRKPTTTTWYTELLFAWMRGITLGYFFFVGSSIGSFINVVAYRMPRQVSVITVPSACPRCRQKIRGHDNIPMISWWLLGGKCRHCNLPISKRYPLVELWFGIMISTLFLCEAILGAANLPGREPPSRTGIPAVIWGFEQEVMIIFGYHFLLLTAISTLALFKLDRNRVPIVTGIIFVLLLGLLPSFLFYLHPVTGYPIADTTAFAVGMSIILGGIVGLAIGVAIEAIVGFAGTNSRWSKGFWLASCLVGLALGWQAALSTAILFSLLFFFSRFLTGLFLLANGPLLGIYNLALIVQICCWKSLSTLPIWPVTGIDLASVVASATGICGILMVSRFWIPDSNLEMKSHSQGYGPPIPNACDDRVLEPTDSNGNGDEELALVLQNRDHDDETPHQDQEFESGNIETLDENPSKDSNRLGSIDREDESKSAD